MGRNFRIICTHVEAKEWPTKGLRIPLFFLNESSNVKEYRKTRYALVRWAIPKGRWFRPPGRLFSRVSFFSLLDFLIPRISCYCVSSHLPCSVHNCPITMFAWSSSSVPIKNENNIMFLFHIYFWLPFIHKLIQV